MRVEPVTVQLEVAVNVQGQRKERYAAVHGDLGDHIDVCAADCCETYEQAAQIAREARDVTGLATRVVVVRELGLYRAKRTP